MLSKAGWAIWAVTPALLLAFHYGPGQASLRRDQARDRLQAALQLEAEAQQLQDMAHTAQLRTLSTRAKFTANQTPEALKTVAVLEQREKQAYAAASDAWQDVARAFQDVEQLLEGQAESGGVRWLRARALVRSGEVFNGIEELHQILDEALQSGAINTPLAKVVREELAAAHYYGARLLREEGRAPEVWKQVAETARQQYHYLAEQADTHQEGPLAGNLQRNLERVLDLEQLEHSELVGRPLPKDSPRGRRPGDGEPGRRPGRGTRPDGDQPGNGASGMMEIGDGW